MALLDKTTFFRLLIIFLISDIYNLAVRKRLIVFARGCILSKTFTDNINLSNLRLA